jgi:glucokinase
MPETRSFINAKQAEAPFFVGIDLGGTNIKFGVVDDLGRPMSWLTIPTEVEKGAEDASQRMGAAVDKVIADAGLEHKAIARVGLGSPGQMDIPAGMLLTPINLKGWNYFPLRDRVSYHCDLPVTWDNDANAAAYGEFWVGSGRDFQSMVLFTLGTGIGCGIIIGDTVIQGAHSNGGEAGHIIIDISAHAQPCGCGQHGHLEAYASATGIIRRTQEILRAGRPSSLTDRMAKGVELTPKLIAQEAERGDDLSLEIVFETARYMAIGTLDMICTVHPTAVLLGGAMTFGGAESKLGRRFLARVREEVARLVPRGLCKTPHIDFASLGGDAGYIGAAGIARLEYLKQSRSGGDGATIAPTTR